MKIDMLKSTIILITVQVLFSSCLKHLALRKFGVFDETASFKYITNGENQIVFIPMHHIGKKDFYNDVERKVDSLIDHGYIIYFEGVSKKGIKDSLQKDTIYRKIRKITGVDFVKIFNAGGYIDTLSNEIMGMRFKQIKKYNLVNQPPRLIQNVDSMHTKNVDADLVTLVKETERQFGQAILDEYDHQIQFGKFYKRKGNLEMKKYFIEVYRNNLIVDTILSSRDNKIGMVYGAKHFDGFLKELQAADRNYKQVQKL